MIENNIIQYWHERITPSDVLILMERWRCENKNFTYMLFDYNSAEAFIRDNINHETYLAFKKCKIPSMQSDLFRVCALYYFGGVYIDAGMDHNGFKLVEFLDFNQELILIKKWHDNIINGFIAAKSKSKFLMIIINNIINNINNEISNNIFLVTGAGAINKCIIKEKQNFNIHYISWNLFTDYVKIANKLEYKKNHWSFVQDNINIFTGENMTNIERKKNSINIPQLSLRAAELVIRQRTALKRQLSKLYQDIMYREFVTIEKYLNTNIINILDIGGGIGGIHQFTMERINKDFVLSILDKNYCDNKMLYGYRDKTEAYNSFDESNVYLNECGIDSRKIRFYDADAQQDIEKISSLKEEFDLVLSLKSWCFHYPPLVYLKLVKNILKKDGILIVDIRSEDVAKDIFSSFNVLEIVSKDMASKRYVLQNE